MKIYEWTYDGKKGTVIAPSMKAAKTSLVPLLRGAAGGKRIPKGTKVKKIGLTKDAPAVVADPVAPAAPAAPKTDTEAAGAKAAAAATKRAHEQTSVPIVSIECHELAKDMAFSGGTVFFSDGSRAWVADDAEHLVKKGVKAAFVPDKK